MSNINFNFTGKKFIVTGASSGMGRQVAVELAAAGAIVLAIARREAELGILQQEYPNNIFIAAVDVTDKIALENAIKQFVLQNGKINGAVHAAGISGLTPLKAYDSAQCEKIMNISFWSGVDLIQIATKSKYAEVGSSNVLFSSVSSYTGEKAMFAYSAAKAAVKIAAKSFAKEIANKSHRINTISPGWVNTQMTEGLKDENNATQVENRHLLDIGRPSDVSGVVLFLLSDRASWITGTDIVVDGGYLA